MTTENDASAQMIPRALLLFAYGQSNADGFRAGPRPETALLRDERVVTLTAGGGLRGYNFSPDGTRLDSAGEFFEEGTRLARDKLCRTHPMALHDIKNSSILHATASKILLKSNYQRIYVRAFCKAGLRLVGIHRPENSVTGIYKNHLGQISPILLSLIEDAISFRDEAVRNGETANRAYIMFIHGEADRSTGTDAYLQSFSEAKAIIDNALIAAGIQPHWLVTQTGGTDHQYGGNNWTSRLAAHSFVREQWANTTFVGPLYPYPLQDAIHHNATAKALIGELFAAAIEQLESGADWQTPYVSNWWLEGDSTVMISVSTPEPLRVCPASNFENLGFSLPANARNRIIGAQIVANDQIRIELEKPIQGQLQLGYAYKRGPTETAPSPANIPMGGGSIRTRWSCDSKIIPGQRLYKWLPGFMLMCSKSGSGS